MGMSTSKFALATSVMFLASANKRKSRWSSLTSVTVVTIMPESSSLSPMLFRSWLPLDGTKEISKKKASRMRLIRLNTSFQKIATAKNSKFVSYLAQGTGIETGTTR